MKIIDGIILEKDIQGIQLKLDIVEPFGKKNVRTHKPMKPAGLTIHNTANTSPSAGDEQHGEYLQNVENSDSQYVSWHFTVDHDSITQHLPLIEQGFHASDGTGPGNSTTIAIEIAENKDYEVAEQNAIKLIVELMKHYNFTIDKVQPHRYYAITTKKLCPRRILKSESTWKVDWKVFQDRVFKEFNKEVKEEVKEEVGQVVRYNSVEELPDYARAAIQRLINNGWLNGNSKGELDLSIDIVRSYVVNYRAGLYDK